MATKILFLTEGQLLYDCMKLRVGCMGRECMGYGMYDMWLIGCIGYGQEHMMACFFIAEVGVKNDVIMCCWVWYVPHVAYA